MANLSLDKIPTHLLGSLADALERGALGAPLTPTRVQMWHGALGAEAATQLEAAREALGGEVKSLAAALRLVSSERDRRSASTCELVWTGPEVGIAHARDTAVVARELFSRATTSVLIATYVVYQGQDLFASLAEQMLDHPELEVHLVLNVSKKDGVEKTADAFIKWMWPKHAPQPKVYYDPRSLEEGKHSISMHAKCIVVDERFTLVTSANFTEAAHRRNIEAGALIEDPAYARAMRAQFEDLIQNDILIELPLPKTEQSA